MKNNLDILIIPGSYKSCISSSLASDILYQKIKQLRKKDNVKSVYISDGGEGTLEVVLRNFGGKKRSFAIRGMQGKKVIADTIWFDKTVWIESSSAVGYSLVYGERNPWYLTSHPLGELVLDVISEGAKTIYISMGDSAVMDIGIGMLEKLGVRFYDIEHNIIKFSNLSLLKDIKYFDTSGITPLKDIDIIVLGDTKDYLVGEYGQIKVYGRQKGLLPEYIDQLEKGYNNIVNILDREFGVDLSTIPMATGSGGIAAGLYAFLQTDLLHCPSEFSNRMNLPKIISDADILITGEGKLDNQTKWGKIPYFVSKGFTGIVFLVVGEYTADGFYDICKASNATVIPIELKQDISIIDSFEEAAEAICEILENRNYVRKGKTL